MTTVLGSNAARSQVQPPMSPRSQPPPPVSPRSQAPQTMTPRSQAMPMSPRSQASRPPQTGSGILSPARSSRPIPASAIAAANAAYNAPSPSVPDIAAEEPTPTPSRPASPVHDLTAEEQRLVNEYMTGTATLRPHATGLGAGTRTSYAPSAAAPSALEPDVANSHFHDAQLCELLHALDQPMAEPVKKAIRKAVRGRVKKLGMKYDNEVSYASQNLITSNTDYMRVLVH